MAASTPYFRQFWYTGIHSGSFFSINKAIDIWLWYVFFGKLSILLTPLALATFIEP